MAKVLWLSLALRIKPINPDGAYCPAEPDFRRRRILALRLSSAPLVEISPRGASQKSLFYFPYYWLYIWNRIFFEREIGNNYIVTARMPIAPAQVIRLIRHDMTHAPALKAQRRGFHTIWPKIGQVGWNRKQNEHDRTASTWQLLAQRGHLPRFWLFD